MLKQYYYFFEQGTFFSQVIFESDNFIFWVKFRVSEDFPLVLLQKAPYRPSSIVLKVSYLSHHRSVVLSP